MTGNSICLPIKSNNDIIVAPAPVNGFTMQSNCCLQSYVQSRRHTSQPAYVAIPLSATAFAIQCAMLNRHYSTVSTALTMDTSLRRQPVLEVRRSFLRSATVEPSTLVEVVQDLPQEPVTWPRVPAVLQAQQKANVDCHSQMDFATANVTMLLASGMVAIVSTERSGNILSPPPVKSAWYMICVTEN
jgi:hypothetical protein